MPQLRGNEPILGLNMLGQGTLAKVVFGQKFLFSKNP
jgi:hypothetical protein